MSDTPMSQDRMHEIIDRATHEIEKDAEIIACMRADLKALDAVVHELGIEDSFTTPVEAVRALRAELEDMTLARGRLRLWLEFIHHNCTSPDAREFAGSALNGGEVPEDFDWDCRG